MDNLIRNGLDQIPWVPAWLQRLKHLLAFLRNHQEDIVVAFLAAGHAQEAALLERTSIEYFAKWRWGTLYDSQKSVNQVYDALLPHIDILRGIFNRITEGSQIDQAFGAFEPSWHLHHVIVYRFVRWVSRLQRWAGGCPCHAHDDPAGRGCPRRGRRLPEAAAAAEAACGRALLKANGFHANTFGAEASPALLREAQGLWRRTVAALKVKVAFLDRVPYVLARVGEPGVRDRVLQQWDSRPPTHHDSVTRHFLEGDLGDAFREMREDASDAADNLRFELQGIKAVPLDDTVAEGPHAQAARVSARTRRARHPWVFATMRLQQNVRDMRDWPGRFDIDDQRAWNQAYSVINPPGKNCGRAPRMPLKAVLKKLYTLQRPFEPEGTPLVANRSPFQESEK